MRHHFTFINGTQLWNHSRRVINKTYKKILCDQSENLPFISKPTPNYYSNSSHTHTYIIIVKNPTFFLLKFRRNIFFLLTNSHVTFCWENKFSLAQLKLSWMSTISCIVWSIKRNYFIVLIFLDKFTRKKRHRINQK